MFSNEILRIASTLYSQYDEIMFKQFERHGWKREYVKLAYLEGRIIATRIVGVNELEFTDHYEIFGERLFSIQKKVETSVDEKNNKYGLNVTYVVTDIRQPMVKGDA